MTRSIEKTALEKALKKIKVTHYLHYRDFLASLYQMLKKEIPGYSYLRFAQQLGFSATNVLRLVIIGDRIISEKSCRRITQALDLKFAMRQYWETLVAYNNSVIPSERDALFARLMSLKNKDEPQKLDDFQLQYFGEWYTPVIREILSLKDLKADPEGVQERLRFPLRLEHIKTAIGVLLDIEAISFDKKTGSYVLNQKHIITDNEVDSLAAVRYHHNMIDMAKESITRVEQQQRQISAVTVSIDPEHVDLVKGKIQELEEYLFKLEEQSAAADKEVFQLNVQFFPFTKKGKN